MNKLSTLLISTLVIISCITISCNKEEEKSLNITGITFSGSTITATEGTSYDVYELLKITGNDSAKADINVESADESIVSVDGKKITAVKIGKTKLTATETNTDLKATVDVEVIAKTIAVTGITLDKEEANIKTGETLQLTATIAPADASEKAVSWSVALPEAKMKEVSPEDIATVDNKGLVTAKSAGKVVVTAKTKDGDFTASTSITVENVPVATISISPDPIEIVGNEEVQLEAKIEPENATNKAVTWSLEFNNGARINAIAIPSDYATIDPQTGVITGKLGSEGDIYAVATAKDGSGISAKLPVKITYVEVEAISITPKNITLDIDATQQMTATFTPPNATNQKINWNIELNNNCRTKGIEAIQPEPTDYVTVDDNGLVTAKAFNDYYECGLVISAAPVDNIDAASNVSVYVNPVLATSVAISNTGIVNKILKVSECITSVQMEVSVLPANTTNPYVTWSIGPNSLDASISSSGLLNLHGTGGNATVRVTVTNEASQKSDFVDVVHTVDSSCE